MKIFLHIGVLTIGLTAFAALNASAQAPTGSITNVVTSQNNALYDATLAPLKSISLDIPQGGGDLLVSWDDSFTQDGKGKLTGAGTNQQVAVTNDMGVALSFPGTYQTKGTIKGNKGLTTIRLASNVSGTAFISGLFRNVSASAKYSVTIDTAAGTVTGTKMQKASANGLSSVGDTESITDVIPPEIGDGSWTLMVNFGEPNGTKLQGTATVTLATGQVYPFNFTGTFVSATSQSKLTLQGVDAGAGSKLTVTLQGSAVTSIKGKVSGQVVSVAD